MESPYVPRALALGKALARGSVLLLGPRRTGKSSLFRHEVNARRVFNLLESDTFQSLSSRPSLIREGIERKGELIVIDEIQKLPSLMDEVHVMIEEHGARFLLTGSSARKLTRSHTRLMAGRARTMRLHPFCAAEVEKLDLERALTVGMLPSIYLSDEPVADIRDYVGEYVREEIMAEGLSRKVGQFSRFLDVATISHTQQINYEEIGRDAQVPSRTVRDYFSILEDTLLGEVIHPYRKHPTRKATAHGKFYFFDIAVPHGLLKVRDLVQGTPQHAAAFEHLVFRELRTYRDYRSPDLEIAFYRDVSRREIDFLLNDEVAIEVKSSNLIRDRDLQTLEEVGGELKMKKRIVVCQEKRPRKVGHVEIVPVRDFLTRLWQGEWA